MLIYGKQKWASIPDLIIFIMIIIICIIDQLTNWRCPGLGPGSASKEFVEEGEREQRPRGLWDVSNTCSWIKVGLEVGKSVFSPLPPSWLPGLEWTWMWRLWPWNLKPQQSDLDAAAHTSPMQEHWSWDHPYTFLPRLKIQVRWQSSFWDRPKHRPCFLDT